MTPSWYERYIFPRVMDLACGMPMVSQQRSKVVPLARGRVLEVGIGTGLNLRHYDKSRVSQIVGLDPAMHLHPLARKRIEASGLPVELLGMSAQRIAQPDASFDSVVCTYTLCSIPDPLSALAEMRRVLRADGQLLFCEHGLAPDASVRRWQHRLQGVWGPLAGGCQLSRDIPSLLKAAGFVWLVPNSGYLPGPKPFTFHYWGQALPAV